MHMTNLPTAFRPSMANKARGFMRSGRWKCWFGHHDWEEISATEEQVKEYYRYFYNEVDMENTGDGWHGPAIHEVAPDKVCIRSGCGKAELTFTRTLTRGRFRWEEDQRIMPYLERERLYYQEKVARERAQEEMERRERAALAQRVYAETVTKEISHVRRKFEPRVIRGVVSGTSVLHDELDSSRERGGKGR